MCELLDIWDMWRGSHMSPHLPTCPHMSAHVANFERERGKRISATRGHILVYICGDKSAPIHIAKCNRGQMMLSVRGGGWRLTNSRAPASQILPPRMC